eukprot:5868061-Lingulodinium_polyedra.AAC.1
MRRPRRQPRRGRCGEGRFARASSAPATPPLRPPGLGDCSPAKHAGPVEEEPKTETEKPRT